MSSHARANLHHLHVVCGTDDIFEKHAAGPTVAIDPGTACPVPEAPLPGREGHPAADGERMRVGIRPGGAPETDSPAVRNAARPRAPGAEEGVVATGAGSRTDGNRTMPGALADGINGPIQAGGQSTQLPADHRKATRLGGITARPGTSERAPEAGMGAPTARR
jgi:hypothetical protein